MGAVSHFKQIPEQVVIYMDLKRSEYASQLVFLGLACFQAFIQINERVEALKELKWKGEILDFEVSERLGFPYRLIILSKSENKSKRSAEGTFRLLSSQYFRQFI